MIDTPTPEAQRIAKRISRAGKCSRREAERWIEAGRVCVNGKRIDTPATLVTDADIIEIDGEILKDKIATQLWLYHKPAGQITTHHDPEGRPTVFDNIPLDAEHVISVGRLDANTEGLLLLTNDGALARHLELPDTGWTRRYRVRIHKHPLQETLRKMKKGVTIEGVRYQGISVRIEDEKREGANVWVQVSLSEGKNREIRRVFEHFGHSVSRLIRVAYGPFQLGNLPRGALVDVKRSALKNALGKTFTLDD